MKFGRYPVATEEIAREGLYKALRQLPTTSPRPVIPWDDL